MIYHKFLFYLLKTIIFKNLLKNKNNLNYFRKYIEREFLQKFKYFIIIFFIFNKFNIFLFFFLNKKNLFF